MFQPSIELVLIIQGCYCSIPFLEKIFQYKKIVCKVCLHWPLGISKSLTRFEYLYMFLLSKSW